MHFQSHALSGGVTKVGDQLSDGRDLFYYYDADTALSLPTARDRRALPPRGSTPTMRLDRLTGEWVTMAASRQNRIFLPPAELDPLAPQTEHNPSEIPSLYDVAVFENRSPAFGPTPMNSGASVQPGFETTAAAVGRCEVISFGPEPDGSIAEKSVSRVRTVVEAWADRTRELELLPGVRQVFPFENRGQEIGVTLHHPHGQIYAYPYVTPRTDRVVGSVARDRDLYDRILDSEQRGPRTVLVGNHWTAFVPFAARWPVEIHLLPHRHVPNLAETSDVERDELAGFYRRLLGGIDRLYETRTGYISAWHQAPKGNEEVRAHLQITSPRRSADRMKYLAGSEAAMGAWVADLLPEQSAERFRDAMLA